MELSHWTDRWRHRRVASNAPVHEAEPGHRQRLHCGSESIKSRQRHGRWKQGHIERSAGVLFDAASSRKRRVVTRRVSQKGASAGRDMVAGDKTEYHYHAAPALPGIVEQLLDKLRAEMEQDEQVRHTIES